MTDPPDEVVRLARERAEARAAKDFAAADALRDRIAEAGYRVVDGPKGWTLEPVEAAPEAAGQGRLTPADVGSVLGDAPAFDFSVQWVVQGWPEDVVRGIESLRKHCGHRSVQHVVVDAANTDPGTWPADVEVIALERDFGWAVDRNCGLRRSAGRVVVVVDGSIEAVGDALSPLESALADDAVGVVGPFGIVTRDLRSFEESDGVGVGRDVDTIEGYLMAFRRPTLQAAGFFDEKFRFYRTADIEYSFRVKDTGKRAVVVPVPVTKHEHRMWFNTPSEERAKLSKRNYYLFLDRFRGRLDLCVAPDPPHD